MTANFTQYFDTKIYWTDEIDGCGNTMIDDFLDATSFITEDKTEKITLSDVWEPNKPAVLQTILENNLDQKAHFVLSDNFKSIPEQTFDLIVANPPHFNGDPYVAHYDEPRKYKDLDWSIHKNFFDNVGNYLTQDGVIILAENVWGSNPDTFKDMITKNNLKITHHFPSKQYPLDMWYLGIARESAER
jgi:methylase of polypeptide subunit release factors